MRVVTAAGTLLSTPLLDISGHVHPSGDRGLLGIAVDSSFASNRYLYLLYTYGSSSSHPTGPKTSRLTRVTVNSNNTASTETVLVGSVGTPPCPAPSNTNDCAVGVPRRPRARGALPRRRCSAVRRHAGRACARRRQARTGGPAALAAPLRAQADRNGQRHRGGQRANRAAPRVPVMERARREVGRATTFAKPRWMRARMKQTKPGVWSRSAAGRPSAERPLQGRVRALDSLGNVSKSFAGSARLRIGLERRREVVASPRGVELAARLTRSLAALAAAAAELHCRATAPTSARTG